MTFFTRAALLSVSGVLVTLLTEGQSRRDIIGEERARAMEAIAATAFPGTDLDWEREALAGPDAPSGRLALSGFVRVPFAGGYVVSSAVEFPDETARIVAAARAFEEVAPVRGTLIVLRVSPDGTVVGRRIGELDATSTVTECQRIELVPAAEGREWPYLQIAYRSVHRGDQWVGGITWTAVFDTSDMSAVRRVPVAYWRKGRDGKEAGDVIVTTGLSSTELQLKGRTGGKQWSYQCSGGCRVPPEVILGTP